MNLELTQAVSPEGQFNDRAIPRWQITTIACAILSGGRWHNMTVLDISLGGAKVCGYWDSALPITAVSLTDDGTSVTGVSLILQAKADWVDQASAMTALRFDIPNRTVAANLLKSLSSHIA